MTTFWIVIALVVLASLALIWIPHFRQQKLLQKETAGVRKDTNLELFNERLAVLEKELDESLLDQAEFEALKKELEISLLQDIKQGEDESLTTTVKPKGLLWPSLMSCVLVAVAAYMYIQLGEFENLDKQHVQQAPHSGMSTAEIMSQRVQMMEAQVEADPENSQGWFSLGHTYISANRYDDAVRAFDKVMELVGVHAELLGPKATALYYKAGQQMTPEVQALIDQSLALDPEDASTLLLVGMNAFFTADYQLAINSWETILASGRGDIDRSAIISAIDSAKMRMQGAEGAMPNDDAHKGLTSTAKTVSIEVSVAPELLEQVNKTDMLFVFARPTQGSRMPLAATKVSAASLPITITLDDSTGMGGDIKLSDAKDVEIIAVLSKRGSVKPQTGDLKGTLASVEVGGTAKLVLDTLVQ